MRVQRAGDEEEEGEHVGEDDDEDDGEDDGEDDNEDDICCAFRRMAFVLF